MHNEHKTNTKQIMGFFFNLPKHRTFNYQPVFYDERKEALEERRKKIAEEQAAEKAEPEKYVPGKYIRGNFRRNMYENKKSSVNSDLARILRVIGIAMLLVMLLVFADKIFMLF